ncbi:probable LRR receptor-like serine/threonine-protein kinase At1g05700 [Carica papaya]|uniref:probable LRR receptor-like serine/threonine-protein kinase At1g05700 n=1 Tax=Carica papaya TaxID=3649 RepID=UPI000B8CFAD1|nr:probable LRR receptor-like serine/threonine-protein kinase At1g05700 [Carica papaya]
MKIMEMVRFFLLSVHCAFALTLLVIAQDQSGFISIDCGLPNGSTYKDEKTGINYISDADFIETGKIKEISSKFKTDTLEKRYLKVRSFPDGMKNCYTLKPKQANGNNYLIRAGFMYGDYDGKASVPEFELFLGINFWESVKPDDASTPIITEMIHVPSSDQIDVCLVNTEFGTPFISFLELRLLSNDIYRIESGSLKLYTRVNCDLTATKAVRFPDDVYDRVWLPSNVSGAYVGTVISPSDESSRSYSLDGLVSLSTSQKVNSLDNSMYKPPSTVMQTAITNVNNKSFLVANWVRDDPSSKFYAYFHFAEIEELQGNQSREFNIYVNGILTYGSVILTHLETKTFNFSAMKGRWFDVFMNESGSSTLPPLINAFEVYLADELLQSPTNAEDVKALMTIKSTYKLKRIWHGDPCLPDYSWWQGVNCSYHENDPPRIIYLDLSSSGLIGSIASSLANLRMLQYLDLSNNSLTGTVPEFLDQLPYLRFLNLERNELSGKVPSHLIERMNDKNLTLRLKGNPDICKSESCKKKNKVVVLVVVSISAVVFILLVLLVCWRILKRRNQVMSRIKKVSSLNSKTDGELESRGREFTYAKVVNITRNFEKVIGKGVFGIVYHGQCNDFQVAVKMLTPSSIQGGYKYFRDEARQLLRIRHVNLVPLFAYCNHELNFGLIYEYIPNGSLEMHLSDNTAHCLSWEDRLRIAADVAQGVEYLHNSCQPPIIHGYVKSSNILLDYNFLAKLSDFGLTRILPIENGIHEGYLDPEFSNTFRLTERSDVFSFGVVLLEIITSMPAITRNCGEKIHLTQWVSLKLEKNEMDEIVNPRLREEYDKTCMKKALELAMSCVSPISTKRPNMARVVKELKQCLQIEIARNNYSRQSTTQLEMTPR